MAYTGVDLYNDLKVRTNQGQAGAFLNIDRANSVLRSAIINQFEKVVAQLAIQRNTDEVSPCIKRDVEFTPNNSKVLLKPLVITGVSIGTNCTITFDREHNLVANAPIVVRGIQGVSGGVNGSHSTYTTPSTTTISLTGVTSTGTYTSGTGIVTSNGYIVDDYYHLLAIQYRFDQVLDLTIISLLKNSKLTIITVSSDNNIRTGEYLHFTNFSGVTIGYKYVKKIGFNQVQLFDDAALTIPTILTGTYIEGGTITRSNQRYADALNPDQKIDVYPSTYYYPLYQSSDNNVSIQVYDKHKRIDSFITPTKFVIDYVRTYPEIDLENDTYDLHQDFNAKFLDKVIEYAALKFNTLTSSAEDVQITEIIGGTK